MASASLAARLHRLTGFVTPEGDVWGRPVGVASARDGALFVSDDGSNTIRRVSYQGK